MNESTTEILEFAGDSVVRASAGTGKTFILVEKFLHSLKETDEEGHYSALDNILAITFTDKAANEMRQRISQKISEEVEALEKTEQDGERKHLVRHLRRCRRQMTQAYISTIHSFCARVLRENPIEAGLDPGFEIMDSAASAEMMEHALERFLLMKLRKGDAALIELAYRYGFSSDYAYEMSLKKIIGSLLPLLRAASADHSALLNEYARLVKGIKERLGRFKHEASCAIESLEHEVNTDKRREKLDLVKEGLARFAPDKDAKSEDGYKLAAELSKTSRGFGFKFGTPAREAADRLRAALDGYSKTVVSSLAYRNSSQLRDLLEEFYGYFENRVKSRALLDFDDLQERTLYLFTRRPEVLEHYRKKFRRLLVDEFQDVNGLQKKLIYLLAAPGEGRLFIVGDPKQAIYGFRGGNVEVFNEAETDIEKNSGRLFYLRTNFRSNPELVDYSNSYFSRYSSGIFTENDVCDARRPQSGAPAVESMTFYREELSADDARFNEAALIARRIRKMVTGAEFMVKDGSVMRDVNYGDIVILFRKFTALPIFEAALASANLPYMIHKGSGFYQSQEVADILSVLSYIDNPSDLVSWVGALRSPFAGCSDEMVLLLRRGSNGVLIDPLAYLDGRKPRLKGGDPLDAEKFMEFTGWARELMAVKDRMTISELIETVLEKSRITGILGAQPHGLQKVANVLKLIELARTMEQNSEATLKNFLRRASTFMETGMEEPQAQVAASGEELVRIMTIHQSKGLEFPVVFLADINAAGGPKPSPVIFHPQRGLAVKYVDKARLSAHKGAVFDEVNRLNEEKERDDEERLFYVACTRAQDRLVLSGSRKRGQVARTEHLHELTDRRPTLFAETAAPEPVTAAPSVEKSAYDLLKEEAELETAKPAAVAARKARSKNGAVSQLSISVGRMTSFVRCPREYLFRNLYGLSPAPVPNGGGENAAALGSAVHSALELVEFESDKNFKKSVGAAVDLKLSRWSKTEKKAAVKRIAALYDIDPFKKLRGGELSLVGREVDFTARFGGKSASCLLTGKLDLLLREGGDRIWVVDYKYSGAPRTDTAARFQLELYSLALSAYLGIESVTCALVYLKSEKRRVHKWELDRTRLKKLEKRLLKTALEIYDWEEKGRRFQGGYPSAKLMPEVDCPNPRCGFREFCLS